MEREVPAKWTIFGCEHDLRAVFDEAMMKSIGIVAAKPEGDTMAESVFVSQVLDGETYGKRYWLAIEHDSCPWTDRR